MPNASDPRPTDVLRFYKGWRLWPDNSAKTKTPMWRAERGGVVMSSKSIGLLSAQIDAREKALRPGRSMP